MASIRANGSDTTVWFEHGTNTSYGNVTGPSVIAGTNVAAVSVSNLVHDLAAAVQYHFRVVASNALGVVYGPDEMFSTALFAQVNAALASAYNGAATWVDYDNDGLLDILFCGRGDFDSPITQLWRNTGNGFTNSAGFSGAHSASAAWGDYNNDGRLDLAFAGRAGGFNPFSQLWQNTVNGFSNASVGLPQQLGTVDWGDYNNDGRQDILFSSDSLTIGVLLNTSNGFVDTAVGVSGFSGGAGAWGDFDNDGRLDALISGGNFTGNYFFRLWRNTGNGFMDINAGLPVIRRASLAWGDYDNDGRLDMAFSGIDGGDSPSAQIWRNTGSGFTNINASLPELWDSAVAWGDYDNDGRLDLLLWGGKQQNGVDPVTYLWRNTGNGFTNVNSALPPMAIGSAAWGDYDNDGRLDILFTGYGADHTRFTQVWRNNTPVTNTPPTAPAGLSAVASGSGVRLSWNASIDAQTPLAGLSYNVRVGTTPGGADIVAPNADSANGFRRVPKFGSVQKNRFAILTNLALGTYYWSVQAIDTAFAGSPFATESTFTIALAPIITGYAHGSNSFQVVFSALKTGNYTLQKSSNLIQWDGITNMMILTNGSYEFPDTGTFPSRFYRLEVQ
jgi:hypothetical protein